MIECRKAIKMLNTMDSKIKRTVNPDFVVLVQNFCRKRLLTLEQGRKRSAKRGKKSVSFAREIRCMMHEFGDCKKPLWESVLYVEKILRQQINLLLKKATAVAAHRGGDSILLEDLLFLLRKNKVKLKRLLIYLSIKDAKDIVNKTNSTKHSVLLKYPSTGKRIKACLQFLNKIDNIFSYERIMDTDIPDPVVQKRNERKWAMVRDLSDEEYLEYAKTIGVSFRPPGRTRQFLKWLVEDDATNLYPTEFALEVINYFARETVAEIVDMAVLIKEEKTASSASAKPPDGDRMDDSNANGECSAKVSDDAFEVPENAITVDEIRQSLQLCTKNSVTKSFLPIDLEMVIPDHLLCC